MDRQEELGTTIIGGLDNLAQVCVVRSGFVHGGVMDGMSELLHFGDEGLDNGTVDLTLTEALILGSVPSPARCMPRIDGNSYSTHLLSIGMVVNIKDK